jgi:hypothetical protein
MRRRSSRVSDILRGMLRTLLLAALSTAALAAIPASASAATCKLPADGKGFGPTYLLALSTSGTGCSTGAKVVKAYSACATAHGKSGRCTRKVLGFACREKRSTGPTEFDAKATCRKGKATVRFTYTQFT